MAKFAKTASFKGVLNVDLSTGLITIEETVKGVTENYDLAKVLEDFNHSEVTISFKEEDTIEPIDPFSQED